MTPAKLTTKRVTVSQLKQLIPKRQHFEIDEWVAQTKGSSEKLRPSSMCR